METTVNERVKILREQMGLSQTAFAKKLELDPSAYWRLENVAKSIYQKTVDLLVEKTGCSASWLLTGRGEMFPGNVQAIGSEALKHLGTISNTNAYYPIIRALLDENESLQLENERLRQQQSFHPAPKAAGLCVMHGYLGAQAAA